jgi:hypothetical protein
MSRKPHEDAQSVGACFGDLKSPIGKLFSRARRLAELESAVRSWAGEPLARSLRVANERDGILVIYATSAAALTQVHYRQKELLQRLGTSIRKIEAKVLPTAPCG